jgi:hypothetical protein
MPADVEEGISAPNATCGCTCATSQPSCASGTITISAGSNSNCNNNTNQVVSAGTSCTPLSSFWTNNQSMRITTPSPSGGSCTPNGSTNVPNVTIQHQGRTCAYGGAVGAGCMNQDACIPQAMNFTTCVERSGANACPAGYPVQHSIGTTVSDTRACSACTCAFDPGTCGGTVTLFNDSNCSSGAEIFADDNTCHGAVNQSWRSYLHNPTTNASCSASGSNPSGSADFSDLQTVCCTN